MFRRCLLLLVLLSAALATAQNLWTSFTASNIQDASGKKLPMGRICALPTNANDQLQQARAGSGGQISTVSPACAGILNGVISAGYQLADPDATSPANICYRITVTDTYARQSWTYKCVQWSNQATFNFDNYVPSSAALAEGQAVANLSVTTLHFGDGTIQTTASQGGGAPARYGTVESPDGVRTTFTLTATPVDGQHFVLYWNGLAMWPGDDYTLAGNVVTLVRPANLGDHLYGVF